ncbi:MAG TPA: hypothetical protein VD866_19535 [Urbifossiella sp.]|nr:hypothetical protein [Urbifossiella sp.]
MTDPHDDLAALYVAGLLPAADAHAVEARALADPELAATIGLMRAVTGAAPAAAAPVARPRVRRAAAAAVVLAAVAAGYGAERAVARGEVSRLEARAARLEKENGALLPAGQLVDAAGPVPGPPPEASPGGAGALRSVSFQGDPVGAGPAPGGTVRAELLNDFLPCRLTWKTDGGAGGGDLPLGDARLDLPTGRVRMACESAFRGGWYQPFGVVHNGKHLGTTLGVLVLDLKPGDTLRVRAEHPFAPWNAVTTRVAGELTVLTLERPRAEFDLEPFRAGKWGGTEALPNTALFWARDGSRGLAAELTAHVVAGRGDPAHRGRFRGKMHTSVVFPTTAGRLPPPLLTATAADMTRELTAAFDHLRRQRPPQGPSIREEIELAAKLLKTLPPTRPE